MGITVPYESPTQVQLPAFEGNGTLVIHNIGEHCLIKTGAQDVVELDVLCSFGYTNPTNIFLSWRGFLLSTEVLDGFQFAGEIEGDAKLNSYLIADVQQSFQQCADTASANSASFEYDVQCEMESIFGDQSDSIPCCRIFHAVSGINYTPHSFRRVYIHDNGIVLESRLDTRFFVEDENSTEVDLVTDVYIPEYEHINQVTSNINITSSLSASTNDDGTGSRRLSEETYMHGLEFKYENAVWMSHIQLVHKKCLVIYDIETEYLGKTTSRGRAVSKPWCSVAPTCRQPLNPVQLIDKIRFSIIDLKGENCTEEYTNDPAQEDFDARVAFLKPFRQVQQPWGSGPSSLTTPALFDKDTTLLRLTLFFKEKRVYIYECTTLDYTVSNNSATCKRPGDSNEYKFPYVDIVDKVTAEGLFHDDNVYWTGADDHTDCILLRSVDVCCLSDRCIPMSIKQSTGMDPVSLSTLSNDDKLTLIHHSERDVKMQLDRKDGTPLEEWVIPLQMIAGGANDYQFTRSFDLLVEESTPKSFELKIKDMSPGYYIDVVQYDLKDQWSAPSGIFHISRDITKYTILERTWGNSFDVFSNEADRKSSPSICAAAHLTSTSKFLEARRTLQYEGIYFENSYTHVWTGGVFRNDRWVWEEAPGSQTNRFRTSIADIDGNQVPETIPSQLNSAFRLDVTTDRKGACLALNIETMILEAKHCNDKYPVLCENNGVSLEVHCLDLSRCPESSFTEKSRLNPKDDATTTQRWNRESLPPAMLAMALPALDMCDSLESNLPFHHLSQDGEFTSLTQEFGYLFMVPMEFDKFDVTYELYLECKGECYAELFQDHVHLIPILGENRWFWNPEEDGNYMIISLMKLMTKYHIRTQSYPVFHLQVTYFTTPQNFRICLTASRKSVIKSQKEHAIGNVPYAQVRRFGILGTEMEEVGLPDFVQLVHGTCDDASLAGGHIGMEECHQLAYEEHQTPLPRLPFNASHPQGCVIHEDTGWTYFINSTETLLQNCTATMVCYCLPPPDEFSIPFNSSILTLPPFTPPPSSPPSLPPSLPPGAPPPLLPPPILPVQSLRRPPIQIPMH